MRGRYGIRTARRVSTCFILNKFCIKDRETLVYAQLFVHLFLRTSFSTFTHSSTSGYLMIKLAKRLLT